MRLPQVEEQPDADQRIAEKPRNNGRPYQRLQFLDMETVNDGAQDEGPRGQGHGGHHIEGDP